MSDYVQQVSSVLDIACIHLGDAISMRAGISLPLNRAAQSVSSSHRIRRNENQEFRRRVIEMSREATGWEDLAYRSYFPTVNTT